ncbi:Ion transport protein-domain-containing protein [Cantharellus anzutake]|uniref:Ion transport protein-domain-containing protein n=1 Tax=Cantharellus anzutake TaxID=1750568 RepID=UPI001903DC50|nr:Ion transport protein-domain-containing protein [Cantharellus anzutake]KAF8337378.1 Ion transport protein-domain-containing protein [Cantharellus anzutake]
MSDPLGGAYPSPRPRNLDYDNPFEDERPVPDPYTYPQASQTSLVDYATRGGLADDEQRLTGGTIFLIRRMTLSRVYVAFQAVKRNLRHVSVRVVDLASTGTKDHHVRLKDSPEATTNQTPEQSLPNLGGTPLRGYTLGLFGPYSSIRRSMFDFLQLPWTEPIIFCLIIFHAIVLIAQSSNAICSVQTSAPCPRPNGYFNNWADYTLFILFVFYSLESFARIVISGLFVDPDKNWRDATRNKARLLISEMMPWSPRGPVPLDAHQNQSTQPSRPIAVASESSNPTTSGPVRSIWRILATENSDPHHTRGATRLEAPFQLAIEKQRGLAKQGRPYLRHSWNRVDFISVVCFWIMFILSVTHVEATGSRHIYIFRALSVLRVSRLLSMTSGTETIMRSLKRAAPLLVRVAMFILFAMILFSIIGVQSFKGSFRRTCQLVVDGAQISNLPISSCGGFIDPTTYDTLGYLVNGQPTNYTKGYVCPLGLTCNSSDQNPYNNLQSFDNIVYASLQVIIVASFFISALYFIIGVIIINFWLLNLFVAVITNTFSAIREETKKSAFGAKKTGPTFDEHDEGWTMVDATNASVGKPVLKFYEYTSLAWTLLALVSLGFQATQTSTSSQSYIKLLRAVELYITLAFDVEIVWRILGHLPDWRVFFRLKRNMLDLFLAFSSSVIQIPGIKNSGVYPWLTIFQLGRFYRVILAVPGIRPLLLQVFGNLYGLINMTLFLLMTNLIGGLVAVQLFRGDVPPASAEMNFYQIVNAFLSMYQIFSSENWTTVLYSAGTAEVTFKQSAIAILFLSGWFLFANLIMLQMFIAVINENFEVAEEEKRAEQVRTFVRKAAPTSDGNTWIERFNLYRYLRANPKLVTVESLPSKLVLPMQKSLVQPNRANRGAEHAHMPSVEQSLEGAQHRQGVAGYLERLFELNGHEEIELANVRHARRPSLPSQAPVDDTERHLDILAAVSADHTVEDSNDAAEEERAMKEEFIAQHPTYDKTFWVFSQRHLLRRACQRMVAPKNGDRIYGMPPDFWAQLCFQLFLLAAVLGGIVVSSVANPIYQEHYVSNHPQVRFPWYTIAQAAFALVLVIEFAVKIIADGFMFTPNAYIFDIWNIVDFLILGAILGGTVPTLISPGSVGRFGRALRAFPALRLITIFGFMRSTFHSVIFAGARRILSAAVLAMLYMIPYAVWGLNIFSSLMFSCNDSGSDKSLCVGEYTSNPLDNTNNNLGFLAPRAWLNPQTSTRWSFDNFRSSLLILFEIVSLEGWIDVLTAAMKIRGRDKEPMQDASQVNAIFFVAYNLMGGVVILTLFVSIIIGNFSSRSGMALLTTEQRQWIDLQKLLKRQRPSRRPKSPPVSNWRRWCYYHIVFLLLAFVYSVDICVRWIGLGRSFTANGWNIFDVFVVLGTITTTLAIVGGSKGFAVQQFQKLFLVSMAFKLVQKLNHLNQLFKTSVASLRAIAQLFLLWMVLFVFFGIVYVEVFALTRWNSAETHNQNYTTLPKALVMLAFMTTGDSATEYPYCTNPTPGRSMSDCGSLPWAYSLFITWNVLSMASVVVENFSYVFQLAGPVSVTREEMRAFKKVWTEFDPTRRGYIRKEDFSKFFPRLSGVFDVRIYPVEATYSKLLARARQLSLDGTLNPEFPGLDFSVAQLNRVLNTIDYGKVRKRHMLILLAHHKIIDDEKALRVDELLRRQAMMEYVTDRLNLDRLRSLLKMVHHPHNDPGIPSILVDNVVDGRPSTPPPLSTRDITLASRNSLYLNETPTGRAVSDMSVADLGSRSLSVSRDPSPIRDSGVPEDPQHVLQSLNSSVWGGITTITGAEPHQPRGAWVSTFELKVEIHPHLSEEWQGAQVALVALRHQKEIEVVPVHLEVVHYRREMACLEWLLWE